MTTNGQETTTPRTEEEKMGKIAAQVVLGSKTYSLEVKSINESRKWKEKLINRVTPLLEGMKIQGSDPEEFSIALQAVLMAFPELVADMVCEWSNEIKKDLEQIKEEASEQDMVTAFTTVLTLAYPFSLILAMVTPLTKGSESQPSASSTNSS